MNSEISYSTKQWQVFEVKRFRCTSVKIKSNNKIYNIVGALVLSNSCWAITDEQNLYVRIAMLNKMMCAVLKKAAKFPSSYVQIPFG